VTITHSGTQKRTLDRKRIGQLKRREARGGQGGFRMRGKAWGSLGINKQRIM